MLDQETPDGLGVVRWIEGRVAGVVTMDVTDGRVGAQFFQLLLEVGALFGALLHQALFLKDLDILDRSGAGGRVPTEGEQVTHDRLLVLLEDIVDRLAHDSGGDRCVAGGEALGHGHDVWHEAELLFGVLQEIIDAGQRFAPK